MARQTGLTTGGVTVVLDRLETAGYVSRRANPTDRRSVVVHIVPAKLNQLKKSYRAINEQLGRMLAGYDRGELETVLDFFANQRRPGAAPAT